MSYYDNPFLEDMQVIALNRELFSLRLENVNIFLFILEGIFFLVLLGISYLTIEVYILSLMVVYVEYEIKKALIDQWAIKAFPLSIL